MSNSLEYPIEFRALNEGLGIHPSAFKLSRPASQKISSKILKGVSIFLLLKRSYDLLFDTS